MADLPTGTVTFLLTDIEGSTRLWERHPDVMGTAVARHDALLTRCIEAWGGVVIRDRGEGDSFFAVFARATDAVAAACALQRALHAEPWPSPVVLRVRVGIHTGEAELRQGDYYGSAINRCARLRALAHGGQALLSQATWELVRDDLPNEIRLRDLGTHRLKDLQRLEQVYQILHPELPSDFPPLSSLDVVPNNLPPQMTSFVGRQGEMAELREQLSRARLVTLTGIGGCGKTRLALQVAADLLEAYPDGVWLVELAPITDPALVPQAVAGAIGVREEPGRSLTETLADALQERHLLLVLDNCEHVVAACAALAHALLRACPRLKILATSRELLGVAGELVWPVPSLSLPNGDARGVDANRLLRESEAVNLFVERARLCQPRFELTAANVPAVAQICRRLDGIPLALELAAARVKVLSPEQIAARLDDAFRLLTGGSRTVMPRQQTLKAAIDWSYDLLSQAERRLLHRLSVFAGGWRLEAAEAICPDDEDSGRQIGTLDPQTSTISNKDLLDLLGQLVDKSLVVVEECDGETRYRLLETIRQYAREKLRQEHGGEERALKDRHRDWFLQLAGTAGEALAGATQAEWLNRLEEEHDNLRAALAWSIEAATALREPEQTTAGLRLGAALWRFWLTRGYLAEGRQRLAALLALPEPDLARPEDALTRAAVLNGAGALAYHQAEYDAARALWEESLAIRRALDDRPGIAASLSNLGLVAHTQGDPRAARALHEESLAIRRALDDPIGLAATLNNLGLVTQAVGDFAAARALHEESLTIRRSLDDPAGIAFSLTNLGHVARAEGEYATARTRFQESLEIRRQLGDRTGIAASLNDLGNLALDEGEYEAARVLYEESLTIQRELGDQQGIATSLGNLGLIAHAQGDDRRARALHEESLALCRQSGNPTSIATALGNLALVVRSLGDLETAQALCAESLAIWQRLDDRAGIAEGLEVLATLAAMSDEPKRAARLFGAAAALREMAGVPLPPSDRREQEGHGESLRAALDEATFAAAWAEGAAMPLSQVIDEACGPRSSTSAREEE